ncbi:MAG: hypothetical protein HOP29_10530 [Phycisphaerales bacterium]|nr:hypothetical protein [Phycisphaerales bacterium]
MRHSRAAFLAFVVCLSPALAVGNPGTLHHQGAVTVSGERFTGSGAFRFALLDTSTQTYLWANDGSAVSDPDSPTNAVNLPVVNGVYSVLLGDATLSNMTEIPAGLFEAHRTVALRVWFDDMVGHGVHRLMPDLPMAAAPYAQQSSNADTFAGPLGVGMIIPFYHPALAADVNADPYDFLPRNWVLCDGRMIDESHPRGLHQDEVDSAFWKNTVPDLRTRVARGADAAESIGAVAGADAFNIEAHDHGMAHNHGMAHTHNMAHDHDMTHAHSMAHVHTMAHTHTLNNHTHALPTNTGSVATSGTDPGGHLYLVRDGDAAGWNSGDHLSVADGSSAEEGQHRHSLGGSTFGPSVSGTLGPSLPDTGASNQANTGAASTSNTGASSAANTGSSSTTDTTPASTSTTTVNGAAVVPTVPSYVAVHYIIRIK